MPTPPHHQVTTILEPVPNTAASLAGVLDPARLPTPPIVALRVAQAAARPDCSPREIAALLGQDPALCVKILRAVNSCVYGLAHPVTSLDRAVTVLGMRAVRSLTLGLSIPVIRSRNVSDRAMRDYWVGSVGGAIIARELAWVVRLPCPEDALVAGLLRDLGVLLLREISPEDCASLAAGDRDRLVAHPCTTEQEVFGVSHAEVSAELLRRWKLPAEIVEPVRCHHHPDRLADQPALNELAVVLSLASSLTILDMVADLPDELTRVLALAENRFGLSSQHLIDLLQGAAPKVEEFARLIDQDIGQCPDFATILAVATKELAELNAETETAKVTPRGPVTPLRRSLRWPK